MRNKLFNLFILLFTLISVSGQDLKAFQFYNQKGKPVVFDKMVKELVNYDVVLFGEHHNNSINHWLQLKLTEAIYQNKGNNLVLGAEMFERDNQEGLNHYLAGKILDKDLKDQVRLWNNFNTDYKPLLDFAKNNQLPFIATNVPRRYASAVSKNGVDSLTDLPDYEKKWMIKLPYTIDYNAPGYPEMIKMMGDHAGTKAKQFVAAQAIKDATMAESIILNLNQNKLFLHYNGDYHSKQYGGIYWYLKLYKPSLKVAVIQILESKNISLKLEIPENENFILTDFTLVLPEDITKTY
ncbi:MAG: ChaN family lipoprotein [Weeksellaceae bacterium]|nr:ChaN family lipoprotein [Weeksellaceae bacterium]